MDCNDEDIYKKCRSIKSLETIKLAVDGWVSANLKYSSECKINGISDVSWWHIERSHISMLSAGAWLNGLVSIEEYSTIKKKGNGRCDLYIMDPGKSKKYGVSIEAKKLYFGPNSKFSCILKKLESALCDAMQLDRGVELGKLAGVVFCTYYIPCYSYKNRYLYKNYSEGKIKEFVNSCDSSYRNGDFDGYACFFPKKFRDQYYCDDLGVRKYFPGAAVFYKLVK